MKKLLLYIALVLYCNVNAQQLAQLPSTQPLAQLPSTQPLVQLPFNNYHLTTETEQIELYTTYLNNTSSEYSANNNESSPYGTRTRTVITDQGILSPPRLPSSAKGE